MQPFFDPTTGTTIRKPPGLGGGYWAGAPTVWYDRDSAKCYLSYRLRRPRGVAPDRGGETRIAVSTDGIRFEDIWRAEKARFDSPSIERCSLVRTADGRWCHYVSYVDAADGRWRVDRLAAASVEALDPATREPVFTAGALGIEGVKDPNIVLIDGTYWMLLSYIPTPPEPVSSDAMHGTADIYNTGLSLSCTAMARSHDGVTWEWQGDVMQPDPGADAWDQYARRVTTLWPDGNEFAGFYDGSASVDENYEERTGLAASRDLRRFQSRTPDAPLLISPHGTGALRYIDCVEMNGRRFYYYETAMPDGSHDLRVAVAPPAA